MKTQVPDEQLILDYRAGDIRAFDEIVSRYKKRIFQWILKFTGEPTRAEELTQECFIRVYRHLLEFDAGRSFRTWIYRIAVNLAKNELRDRSRRPDSRGLTSSSSSDPEEGHTIDPPAPSVLRPDVRAEEAELRIHVSNALEQMPEKFKEVFLLRELEGMSYEEIATVLNRPVGTVRSRVNRARERFRKLIEAQWTSGTGESGT